MGANTGTGADITVQNFGGAPALPLTFNINGTVYQFPFVVSGVVGPNTSTVGAPAIWNNATGTLLSDGGTNDGYFGSGRPWCDPRAKGALGNGSTDDYAAFNTCNTALVAKGGGYLFVPPGHYCIKSGTINPGTGVTLFATGTAESDAGTPATPTPPVILDACGVDNTIVSITNPASGMQGFDIHGYTFGATKPSVSISTGAQKDVLINNNIVGGTGMLISGVGEIIMLANRVTYSYGNAQLLIQNGGMKGTSNVFNTHWTCTPSGSTVNVGAIPAWSNGLVVAACGIVNAIGPDGAHYYVQTVSGGTTAASGPQPTLQQFGSTWVDGSVTFALLRPVGSGGNFYGIQCDTGCNNLTEAGETDHSGASIGLGLTNTLAGGAPSGIREIGTIFTDNWTQGIFASTGQELTLVGIHAGACHTTNCTDVEFGSSWTGLATITGGRVYGGVTGISFDASSSGPETVTGVQIDFLTNAIVVGANVNDVVVSGGNMGSSVTTAFTASGTSDHLIFRGVNCDGATTCISSTASGAHNDLAAPGAGMVFTGFGTVSQNNPYQITGTQPSSISGTQNFAQWTITSAGSSSQTNRAFNMTYGAGYTGNFPTIGIRGANQVNGVGSTAIAAAESNGNIGNFGINAIATGTGTGAVNIGEMAFAQGALYNIGVEGSAQVSTTQDAGINIGLLGTSFNAGPDSIMVGVFAGLNQTNIAGFESAALIADNGSQSVPIIDGRANGTVKFRVDATGQELAQTHRNIVFNFGSLPSALQGMTATIGDGLAGNCGDSSCTTFGTTVTGGGGALHLQLWYNGTNWTLTGK
jgi:hypothetical protein